MEILYPLDGTVFPPELPPPTFRWKQVGRTRVWRVTVHFTDAGKELVSSTRAPEWTPTEEQWEATVGHEAPEHFQVPCIDRMV